MLHHVFLTADFFKKQKNSNTCVISNQFTYRNDVCGKEGVATRILFVREAAWLSQIRKHDFQSRHTPQLKIFCLFGKWMHLKKDLQFCQSYVTVRRKAVLCAIFI